MPQSPFGSRQICRHRLTRPEPIRLIEPIAAPPTLTTAENQMHTDDHSTPVEALKEQARDFVRQRDWSQFHTPKDLAIGLCTEAAELLELFRFRRDDEIAARLQDPDFRRALGDELADALYFILLLSDNLQLDLSQSLRQKMALSAERYPVDKARGKNLKYTELDNREGTE